MVLNFLTLVHSRLVVCTAKLLVQILHIQILGSMILNLSKKTWVFRIYCYLKFGKVLLHPKQNKWSFEVPIGLVWFWPFDHGGQQVMKFESQNR